MYAGQWTVRGGVIGEEDILSVGGGANDEGMKQEQEA